MIPTAFDYKRASSVDEAIQLLEVHGMDAKIVSGGHSLIPALKLRLNSPAVLIDIAKIPELRYIREENGEVVIGALSTHREIAESALVQEKLPFIAEAGNMIGDVQVRNNGTLGGSLAHADPAADWPATLIAAEASIIVAGKDGKRSIPIADFFEDIYLTKLAENEIITEIRVPALPANTKSSYQKFVQPASRFAIVGAAVAVTENNGVCNRARVSLTGVSNYAYRETAVEDALVGKPLTKENIEAAANAAAEGMEILSDHFASEEYRKHLAKTYVKRALMAAS